MRNDIQEKIRADFGEHANKVRELLETQLLTEEYLNSNLIVSGNIDRIIRCIIFLANRNQQELQRYIQSAKQDARDVMFWAEYENLTDAHPKKVRDFSEPFS